jgi:SpoVK/Ycf46/Vps4 family AAA+-type ATPase
LHSVKEQIDELATYLQFLQLRQQKGFKENQRFALNTVFTGNPGTGKTTVARLLGKIYYSLGLLTNGKVVEVGRADLVGEFIGQTAPKVKKAIESAKGGILFIDEAYSLSDRGDDSKDFGKEVMEVLLKEMEGQPDIAFVFAGYPKEMQQFLNFNPGLGSRLRNVIHFPDYSPDELMEIATYTTEQRGVSFSDEAKTVVHRKIVEAYRNRGDNFGNGRFVNSIIDEAKQNMAIRLMRDTENVKDYNEEQLSTIALIDVEKIFGKNLNKTIHIPIDDPMLKDALAQLNELVGLDDLKKQVAETVKLVRYYTEIGKDVRKSFSLHSVFTGNPGTGKTTVARIFAQIFKALGILEKGHLVESDRRGLVAEFIGQTAVKTGALIDSAVGGCLFIDEAYSLTQGYSNDFGREAVETLLKRMEDQRGEFMVIVAGYTDEMKKFLEMNPGLMSRFDKTYSFADYSENELLAIADNLFAKEDLQLSPEARQHIQGLLGKMLANKHKYFGNGRTVRKMVEETIRSQNLRIADTPAATRTYELIHTITLQDVLSIKIGEQEDNSKKIGFNK